MNKRLLALACIGPAIALVVFLLMKEHSSSHFDIEGRVFKWKDILIIQFDVSHTVISGTVLEHVRAVREWNAQASHRQFRYMILQDSLVIVVEKDDVICGWMGNATLFPFALNDRLYELNTTGNRSVIPFRLDVRELTLTNEPSMTEALKELRFDRIDNLKQSNADNGLALIAELSSLAHISDNTLALPDEQANLELRLRCTVTERQRRIKQFAFDLGRHDDAKPLVSFRMEADSGVWAIQGNGLMESGTIQTNKFVSQFGIRESDGTNRWPYPEKFKNGVMECQRVLLKGGKLTK